MRVAWQPRPVSLLPHTQAFLTQEDLDMSLSVSVKLRLWVFLIMSLSMLVQSLTCGGITLEAGRWFVYRDALNSKC